MISIEQVDTKDKSAVRSFLRLPFRLYEGHQLWVPPILLDAAVQLNPEKHPFYEHSEAEFFIARQDGEVVGRIALLVNNPYNEYHDKRQAQFYLFECIQDRSVAEALFQRAFEWAKDRDLDTIIGPMGFSALATDISAIGLEGVTTEFVGYPGAYEKGKVVTGLDDAMALGRGDHGLIVSPHWPNIENTMKLTGARSWAT